MPPHQAPGRAAGGGFERSGHDLSSHAESIRVNIFNQAYSLRSATGDGERVRRVARTVDERMRAIASQLAVHDVAKVAVLTALNIADELEGLREFYEQELQELLAREQEGAVGEARGFIEELGAGEEFGEEHGGGEGPVAEEAAGVAGGAGEDAEAVEAAASEEQTWFDSIFDSDTPSRIGEERLSSQVSSRLRSHVSSRLRRFRQTPAQNPITEDTGGEG